MIPKVVKRVRYQKDIITRVTRTLPGNGKLSVQEGQEVTPDEVIGSSTVSGGFRIINLSQLLGVAPASIERYLQRKVGQNVYKGELLAYKSGGLFRGERVITAPTDGVIDFINPSTGEIKLGFLPKKMRLPAAVFGIVESVDDSRGQVLIKTQITRIHGIFGTGLSRDGILHVLDRGSDLINSDSVSTKYAGYVLVNRGLIYKDAISASISVGVCGIITGGIGVGDYKGMAGGRLIFPKKFDNDVGISVIVCEGFDLVPIGQDIFNILSENDQRFVFIDGNRATVDIPSYKSDCMVKIRQTQLPPQPEPDAERLQAQLEDLSIGAKVRVIGMTYLGEQGKIIRIDKSKTRSESGILSQFVTIETNTRKIQVPITNIEII